MTDDRLRFIDDANRIYARHDLTDLASDAEAIRDADAKRERRRAELWEGGRIVRRFGPQSRPPDA